MTNKPSRRKIKPQDRPPVLIGCVKIEVKVVDDKDNPVRGVKAQIRYHSGVGLVAGPEPLGSDGKHEFHVRQSRAVSWLDIIGPRGFRTQTSVDLNENGKYLFKFLKCTKPLSPVRTPKKKPKKAPKKK